jgi:hypothetical protein
VRLRLLLLLRRRRLLHLLLYLQYLLHELRHLPV